MLFDFQPYLESIRTTYAKWWQLYTLTDAAGKQRQSKEASPFFDFGLIVRTVKREERERQVEEKSERFSVLDGIRKYADEQVLLVGRPGSGKSTALARLMLEEATKPQARIPVLVELRYWQGSIEQLILNSLRRHESAIESLDQVLPRSLLLFDGVNELPSEEARSQLSAFRRNHPKLPMIFTTRDLSIGGDLGIEKRLEMQPLTEAQMQAFIRAYLPEQAEAMLRQLRDRLREFGRTPLLLWMLCGVFQQTGTIPENLGLVFREFTQGYEQYLKDDVRVESDRAWWRPVLQQLAWVMMQGEKPTELRVAIREEEAVRAIAQFLDGKVPYSEDFARKCLRDLQKHHLIQVGANCEEAEFRHQLIQEYYAAEKLLEQLPTLGTKQLEQEFLNFLKWTEPVALMLAMVDKTQAEQVVQRALEVDLILGKWLAGKVQLSFQERITELVEKKVPNWLKPTLPLSFLPSGFELFPPDFELSQTETLPQAVLDLVVDPDSSYEDIWSEAYGLDNIGSNNIIPSLLKLLESSNSEVRWRAAVALGQIGSFSAIPNLLKLLKDPDSAVCCSAIEALGEMRSEAAIPELCKLLMIQESSIRQEIAVALGKIRSEAAIEPLLRLIADSKVSVRAEAAHSLGNIGSATAISGLLQLLKDSDVSLIAAGSIRRIARKSEDKTTIAQHLPYLLSLISLMIPTEAGEAAHIALLAIQENCKYYNYEIYQAYLEAQEDDRQTPQNNDRSPTTINNFPNATEVRIFENVDRYYETPHQNQDSAS